MPAHHFLVITIFYVKIKLVNVLLELIYNNILQDVQYRSVLYWNIYFVNN